MADLLKRSLDCGRITAKVWYVPVLFLMPGVMVVAYGLMRALGLPLPARPEIPVAPALVMFFVAAALCEELGWSGYALDPLQERWGALSAGVLLGAAWAAWHLVPPIQARRAPAWIAGWCLSTVASRILIVWLYNNTGRSVFAASLHHAASNISWVPFPNDGSHHDPRISGPIVALAAVIVTAVWARGRWREGVVSLAVIESRHAHRAPSRPVRRRAASRAAVGLTGRARGAGLQGPVHGH